MFDRDGAVVPVVLGVVGAVLTRVFLSALYRLLRRERGKVQALLTAGAFDSPGEGEFPVDPIFVQRQQVTGEDVSHYGFAHLDVELTTAVCFGAR